MSNYDRIKIETTERIGRCLGILAGLFLCVATVFMFINIVTRMTVDYNLIFIYDLCGLCAAGTASFAIPYATFKSAHTSMDTIIHKLPARTRGVCEAISGVITMVVMLFTIYAVGSYTWTKTLALELTTTSKMPTFIFRWFYVIGLVLTLIAAALEMIDMFRIAAGKQVVRDRDAWEALEAEARELEEAEAERIEKEEGEK